MLDIISREEAHAAIDEIFDSLERLTDDKESLHQLNRVALFKDQFEHEVSAVVLVSRPYLNLPGLPFVTWALSRVGGFYSGHYDLGHDDALSDWLSRVMRGW